ncbi:MAG: MSHA biogenesis protein MshE, partial [Pseudomonadales bacterium]
MSGLKKVRIGDLLLDEGVIRSSQLESALAEQKGSGKKLGRLLIESGAVTEDKLLSVLSKQLGLPFVGLRQFPFNVELVNRLEEG